MDVKNTFLNEHLLGEYTSSLFLCNHPPHKDCRLHQGVQGLKQTPRARYSTFRGFISQPGFITQLEFISCPLYAAVVIKQTKIGTTLLLYVDGIIITINDYRGFTTKAVLELSF